MSRFYSGDTQISWVCREFLTGRELCHLDEIDNVRGWRLAAIVCELKKRYGWVFTKRDGPNKVAYYRLCKGADWSSFRMPRSCLKEKGSVAPPPPSLEINSHLKI